MHKRVESTYNAHICAAYNFSLYTSCSLLYDAFVDFVADEVDSSYSNSRDCVGVTDDLDITSYFDSFEQMNG